MDADKRRYGTAAEPPHTTSKLPGWFCGLQKQILDLRPSVFICG